jgi:hypothetical protein
MIEDRDHYEAYYASKLWNLLPVIYRSLDTDQFEAFGPLREMVNRLGAQAAILRRSIDRSWEDQSIETCDDWVIPYIGDLLATNLVANLDAAGQRLDVSKTIYYRRRKGTLAVLEEIAANITGWDAKVVEFFRRMARTRHGLDPAIGLPSVHDPTIAQLQLAQGLTGTRTGTPMGGTARLTNVYGATKAQSPFDEFFHTADFRFGTGHVGWYSIPRLGVFLWRLKSFLVGPVTPAAVQGCPGWFTFDPTGRNIPLFALSNRNQQYYSQQWVSPTEAQLPTPISQSLFDSQGPPFPLYPVSLAVFATPTPGSTAGAIDLSQLRVRPSFGRVEILQSPPEQVWLQYCYGFSSTTGAGPYDRRAVRAQPAAPAPARRFSAGGTLQFPPSGTLSITDSLTYEAPSDVVATSNLTIQAENEQRPLFRFAPTAGAWTQWNITGQGASCLALDGLFVSGADIVLSGPFKSVTITCCTFDPGSAASSSTGTFVVSADGRALTPSRLWVEGTIENLTIQRSVIGPIRTRGNGEIETLTITDSVIQGIRSSGWGAFEQKDLKDPERLERVLLAATDPVSRFLIKQSPALQQWANNASSSPPSPANFQPLVDALNTLLTGPSLYDHQAFARVPLSGDTRQRLADRTIPGLNRSLLEDAYPQELADAALAVANGDQSFSRCTVLDRLTVHRLQASESILAGLAAVDDAQHGCVRFSAWTKGSILPRQFESVQIQSATSLFTSTDFGQPAYAQLLPTADSQISKTNRTMATTEVPTILSGAEDGSEMGAFCLEKNPIKERGILIKYQEFMPSTLVPVIVYET